MAEDFKNMVDEIVEKAKIIATEAGKKVSEYAQVAVEKTGDVYDMAKKKVEIEKIEYALNKKYRELGKACYAKVKGEEVDPEAIITEIDTLKEALDVLNAPEPDDDDIDDDAVVADAMKEAEETCECCCKDEKPEE